MLSKSEESNIVWQHSTEGENSLPKYSRIIFYTDEERRQSITVRWNHVDNTLHIQSSDKMVLELEMANSLFVKVGELK